MDQADGAFLAVGVGAEGGGLDQQHGAFAVARGPYAVADVGLGAGVEAGNQRDQFAGRVARQQRLDHHAGRRGEQVDAVADGLAQAIDREALGRDGRAEQVTVLEQVVAVGVRAAGFAVLDRDEFRQFFQTGAQRARGRRAVGRVAAGDGDHQQARDDAFLQLVDQHLLLGAWFCRQEEGHVGREAAVPDDDGAGQHGQQPQGERAAGWAGHLPLPGSTGSILSTTRSPSACRYSMMRTWFLLPVTVMRWTMLAIFWSLGRSVSTHLSELPARCRA